MCQTFARPSKLEYWHMGESTMRLRNVTPRIVSVLSRSGVLASADAVGSAECTFIGSSMRSQTEEKKRGLATAA
jgi:hypothetical protein